MLFHKRAKINFKFVKCFRLPRSVVSSAHVSHALHHKFTTKTPHKNTGFFQTPLKKHSKIPNRHHASASKKKTKNSDIK